MSQHYSYLPYDRMIRAAIRFYITTGNPAELDAAYWYTRYAYRLAQASQPFGRF